MLKIFIDGPLFIKIFGTSFTALGAMTTGAFYYASAQQSKVYEASMMQIYKQKEHLEMQEEQLAKLRRMTVP